MTWTAHRLLLIALLLSVVVAGCAVPPASAPTFTATAPPATPHAGAAEKDDQALDLTAEQRATLEGLVQLDDYPLYAMHFAGGYAPPYRSTDGAPAAPDNRSEAWACSLFAALGDPGAMLYGRNFDWEYSPALLLFTDPPDGYASVSMVDITYLGFTGDRARRITELPLAERTALLNAPYLPFDGMNEMGLAVGMAAVPGAEMPSDPERPTIDSLGVIREMLDHAADVEEALAVLDQYNIRWGGGPPLHYLLADRSGNAALVEFHGADRVVIHNTDPWHAATNFLLHRAGDDPHGICPRYDRLQEELAQSGGALDPPAALALLDRVSQGNTQWSILYGMSTGEIRVLMGRDQGHVHVLQLP